MTIGLHCLPCCCWFFAAFTFINVLASVAAADGDGRSHLSIKRKEGESIVVKTSYGRLAGFRTFIPIGRDFDDDEFASAQDADKNEQQSLPVNVFLGVPFAKPPIGELRFEVLLIVHKAFDDYVFEYLKLSNYYTLNCLLIPNTKTKSINYLKLFDSLFDRFF